MRAGPPGRVWAGNSSPSPRSVEAGASPEAEGSGTAGVLSGVRLRLRCCRCGCCFCCRFCCFCCCCCCCCCCLGRCCFRPDVAAFCYCWRNGRSPLPASLGAWPRSRWDASGPAAVPRGCSGGAAADGAKAAAEEAYAPTERSTRRLAGPGRLRRPRRPGAGAGAASGRSSMGGRRCGGRSP